MVTRSVDKKSAAASISCTTQASFAQLACNKPPKVPVAASYNIVRKPASVAIDLPSTSANTSSQNERQQAHARLLGGQQAHQQQFNQLDQHCHRHRHQQTRGSMLAEHSSVGSNSRLLDSHRPTASNSHNNNASLHATRQGHNSTSSLANNRNINHSNHQDSSDDPATPPPSYHEIPGVVPAYQGRSSGPPPSYEEVVNPNVSPPTYQSLFGQAREARKTSNGLVDLLKQLFLILIGTLGCTMIIGFLLIIPITMIIVGAFYLNECRAESIPSFLIIGGLVWIVKNVLNCYNQFKKNSTTANRPPPRRAPIATNNSNNNISSATAVQISASSPAGQAGSQTQIQISTNNSHSGGGASNGNAIAGRPNNSSTSEPLTSAANNSSSRYHANVVSSTTRSANNRIQRPSLIRITSYKCESLLNYFLIVWFVAGCIIVFRIYEPDYENPLSSSYCHRAVYLYAFWLMTSAFIIMATVLGCLCCLMVSSLMSCNHGR